MAANFVCNKVESNNKGKVHNFGMEYFIWVILAHTSFNGKALHNKGKTKIYGLEPFGPTNMSQTTVTLGANDQIWYDASQFRHQRYEKMDLRFIAYSCLCATPIQWN